MAGLPATPVPEVRTMTAWCVGPTTTRTAVPTVVPIVAQTPASRTVARVPTTVTTAVSMVTPMVAPMVVPMVVPMRAAMVVPTRERMAGLAGTTARWVGRLPEATGATLPSGSKCRLLSSRRR